MGKNQKLLFFVHLRAIRGKTPGFTGAVESANAVDNSTGSRPASPRRVDWFPWYNAPGVSRNPPENGAHLTETDYFGHLEMRVSREFAGMSQRELRGWWCDGFIPEKFVATGKGCHVAGKVWIDNGSSQKPWNFVLLLGSSAKSFDDVDWTRLIPAEDVTGWLSLDFERQFLKIKPYAGIPDGSPAP